MTTDPVIDEVRRVRKLISDEIGPDLRGLVDHYSKYQSRFKRKPIDPTDRRTFKGLDSAVNEEGEPGGGKRLSNGKELASG